VIYPGSCHCGAIRFSAEGAIGPVLECNCSMCSRKGSLLWFVPRAKFAPYALGKDPQGNEMAAINVRCLEGIDLGALQRVPFDGRSR
jgi:hypothetical protein